MSWLANIRKIITGQICLNYSLIKGYILDAVISVTTRKEEASEEEVINESIANTPWMIAKTKYICKKELFRAKAKPKVSVPWYYDLNDI